MRPSSPSPPSAGSRRGPGAAIAIAGVAIVGILAAGWLIIDPGRQAAAIQRRLPVTAVAALESSGCTARLLPAYGWAGYVIWTTGRQVGAYGNSSEGPVTEQARLEAVLMDPRRGSTSTGSDAVLMPAGGPLSHWLDEAEAWRRRTRTRRLPSMFGRASPVVRSTASSRGLPDPPGASHPHGDSGREDREAIQCEIGLAIVMPATRSNSPRRRPIDSRRRVNDQSRPPHELRMGMAGGCSR